MNIKTLICDLDGTLFPACTGMGVDPKVEKALIALQEKGIRLILNTARILHGVYPLAKQLRMDEFGGYVVCCNGAFAYDMQKEAPLFIHDIKKEDAFEMWNTILAMNLDFSIAQPEYVIANYESDGFYIDRVACKVDYLCTYFPEKYVKNIIWKCGISSDEKTLDARFNEIKETMEAKYPYKFVRSAECYIDVTQKICSKEAAMAELFEKAGGSWEETCMIGDGNSDAEMIRLSAYGVTLENGTDLCKKNAKKIVKDIKELGCLTLFEELLEA